MALSRNELCHEIWFGSGFWITRQHHMCVRIRMLRKFIPIVLLFMYGCTDDALNSKRNGLSVEIDRSFEKAVSQTYIKITSKDGVIYCISSTEVDRLYSEMGDGDITNQDQSDKDVNYMRGVDITEPIYFVDDVGMKIFVDNFDKTRTFKLSYYKCTELLDKKLSETSIEKTLVIK